MAAVELQMKSGWKPLADVAREGRRDDHVLASPDEQGVGLERGKPCPESVAAVRFLKVDG